MVNRDRDDTGRPRNARARDALGRPLPPGAEGIPRIPDDLALPPTETLNYAQDLLNLGLAFNAHEVFEAAWKNGPDDERTLWQGLAQFAVGITHLQRGNHKGGAALLRRASALLGRVTTPVPYDVDIAGLIKAAEALADDVTAGVAVAPARLRPRLTQWGTAEPPATSKPV